MEADETPDSGRDVGKSEPDLNRLIKCRRWNRIRIRSIFAVGWRFSLILLASLACVVMTSPVVDRSVPEHTVPQLVPVFPDNPSEAQIESARIFSEPLILVGHKPTVWENHQVALAFQGYLASNRAGRFFVAGTVWQVGFQFQVR